MKLAGCGLKPINVRKFESLHMKKPPKQVTYTPDKRYLVINGVLWRVTNPGLDPVTRQGLVDELMSARREISAFMKSGNPDALRLARRKVHQAKISLGERGPVWWTDGSPDFNRYLLVNTPYSPS